MALCDDLLEQANHLARRERRRPRQASLRRAISTAYYALFHLLVSEAVSNWRITAQRPLLARIFEHRNMKNASVRASQAPYAGENADSATHLRAVASTFSLLYQERHAADYDNTAAWSRTEALRLIKLTEEAFASWKAIRNRPMANDYLLSLFVKDRL